MKALMDAIGNARLFLEEALSDADALGLPETYQRLDDSLSAAEDALASLSPDLEGAVPDGALF